MELVDVLIIIGALGFIFHDIFRVQETNPVARYLHNHKKRWFPWHDFWFACSVVAPAILLHELGHKITAVYFGLNATFHAAYTWLVLGIILKLVNFPFIFFVPAFVEITGSATALQHALISFAGPGINLVLWLGSWLVMKNARFFKLNPQGRYYFALTSRINMFLFIFNMLPIPMFDGFSVYANLLKAFTG